MIRGFAIVGAHRVDAELYDALDLAVRTADDRVLALGLRCADYLTAGDDPNRAWDGYTPIPIGDDGPAVRYWDFNSIMWLGPEPKPCVVWSNAVAMSDGGVGTVLARPGAARLVDGRDGGGLPTFADLGRAVPEELTWVSL